MSLSFIDYASIGVDEQTEDITLDQRCIDHIFTEYRKLYAQSNPDFTETQRTEETLRNLANKLNLSNSQQNIEYLHTCIREETVADAKLEIINKFRGSVEYLDYNTVVNQHENHNENGRVSIASAKKFQVNSTTTNSTRRKPKKVAEQEEDVLHDVKELTCIIYKNLNRSEVDDFVENFLFRQVQDGNGQSITVRTTKPLADNAVHTLAKGTILDLFIRRQLAERGNVTFKRPRKKFRLVEPVSLTDEFDSWTFDNFQHIFDFWLTVDPHGNQTSTFPTRWRLDRQAVINYIIGGGIDESATRIRRPSTKSLENFIRDVCSIEDNGMAEEWFETLTDDEDILTYAHLSNLTMPEWEKIRKLPMNALKTIKFYVDQEKNLISAREISTNTEKKKGEHIKLHFSLF